jgi:ABC-2 type transport system permease protein
MWLTALKASWRQNFIMATRYLFNMLSGIITMYIVFLLMFYGVRAVGAGAFDLGSTLEGLFTGYIIWMIVIMGYQELAYNVSNEAQTGTLEQLYVSPIGYKWLAFFSQSFNSLLNLSVISVIVVIMMLTTGQNLNLDMFSILPVFVFVYLQACGLGFALAGLALIFKRIQSFFQIVTFGVIGLFMLPWARFPWAKYLPFTMGQHLLQEIMMNGMKITQAPSSDLTVFAGVTAVCLLTGLALFMRAENKAKSMGLLGQY